MKAVLYRILGNDLPPRHAAGQTLENLRFILAHEPEFPGLEKRWLLNRIVSAPMARALQQAITAAGHRIDHLPFDARQYRRCWADAGQMHPDLLPDRRRFPRLAVINRLRVQDYFRRAKNLYLMNINGARNAALALGLADAQWVLPWDGGCFLTAQGWAAISEAIGAASQGPVPTHYVIVPMARVDDESRLLDVSHVPQADDEPQIAFSRAARERFDPALRYGSMNKAQLLKRLGVPGKWDKWTGTLPWETVDMSPAPDAGAFKVAGWVARLPGHGERERIQDHPGRLWESRFRGALTLTAQVDRWLNAGVLKGLPLMYWRTLHEARDRPIDAALAAECARLAQAALALGTESVLNKARSAPGGEPNDYYTVKPYAHGSRGLALSDGVRREDMVLYSAASECYDRSRMQRMIDACCALALARRVDGHVAAGEKAASLLRAWFVDPVTRMTPRATWAQAWPLGQADDGTVPSETDDGAFTAPPDDHGASVQPDAPWTGIVEFRDLYPLLDAIRLLIADGALTDDECAQIRAWMAQFSCWLRESPQGRSAAASENNIGTWYRLVLCAISAFLGDAGVLTSVVDSLPQLIAVQFAPDGAQPHEARRTRPLHYALFNLQAWANIATLCAVLGRDLWRLRDTAGRGLIPGLTHAKGAIERLPHGPERTHLLERAAVLEAMSTGGALPEGGAQGPPPDAGVDDVLHPDTGIAHFWRLCLVGRPVVVAQFA